MAKYKNREVRIVEDLPHPTGGQVKIEHVEPGTAGFEIVPKNQVFITDDEKKSIEKARKDREDVNDFRNVGDTAPVTLPSIEDVKAEQAAKRGLEKNEEEAKDRDAFQKKYPHAPSNAYDQYKATNVVNEDWKKADKK